MLKPPLAKQASLKLVLILLGLVVLFNVFIMPSLGGGEVMVPLDLQFAYTPSQAYDLINSYSEETKHSYMIGEMTKDVAYPIVYSLLMSITLMLLYPNKWKLAWLPYIVFAADILENTGIITMLYNYPNQLQIVAWLTSGFSTIKWSLVVLVIVIILVGLGKKVLTKKSIENF